MFRFANNFLSSIVRVYISSPNTVTSCSSAQNQPKKTQQHFQFIFQYPELDLAAYLNKSEDIDKLIESGKARSQTKSPKLLPDSVSELPPQEQDLLRRLLETKPQYRLRSVLQLQRIALYKNYDWDSVRTKQVLLQLTKIIFH